MLLYPCRSLPIQPCQILVAMTPCPSPRWSWKSNAAKPLKDTQQLQRWMARDTSLQTFTDNLPTSGRSTLMSEIVEHAENHAKLRQLRNFLVDAIFKPAALAPEFDQDIDKHIATMAERSRPKKGRQYLRRQCLLRDDHRCIMTVQLRGGPSVGTSTFPTATSTQISSTSPKIPYSSRLEFVKEYRQFRIALEPGEGNGNIYTCRIMDPETRIMSVDHFAPQDQPITLTHDDNIPMPSRDLLRIHHNLGKIFHAEPRLNWNVMIGEEGC
ncbi:hypothetical protein QC761_204856 [Podospora bellae-mahoneyi]|uniref:HNH nuclease domain-containing protein n=1 Tax=Podospora bellae-mahoneyi TaxID=2093777 RepID=A0ABR0FPL3_9PEZI|nr:hypothetical protein QC761_204856 [Podospora bellae-mahoneyi]